MAEDLAVVLEIGQIATAAAPIQERARALIEPLNRIAPFQAACISVLNPGQRRYEPLVSQGYERRIQELFASPVAVAEIERLDLHRARTPLRAHDVPEPLAQRPVWAEFLLPAGFREGLSVGLFTTDGRHVGILTMNTDNDVYPTREGCELIGKITPVIADAIDPLRNAIIAARMLGDAQAGVVLSLDREPLPLPGLPGHALLARGSTVLAEAARCLRSQHGYHTFLCPWPGYPPAGHVQVTVLACGSSSLPQIAGVVLLSPPVGPANLTARELQVLGLLIDGCTNEGIAAALGITDRTAAAHVEHILTKLGVGSRTAAAVRALRLGMYVPPGLLPPSDSAPRPR